MTVTIDANCQLSIVTQASQLDIRSENVIGQLVGRFNAKTVWARDMWHLCSRFLRKILSHTMAFFLARQLELDSPLQFDNLLIECTRG